MSNNLSVTEKNLRSLAKRYKAVKYSIGMAILFLMMGVNAFSEEVISAENTTVNQVMSKQEIKSTAIKLQERLNELKKQNEKGVGGEKLELIKLMEQGEQVVKSPWASWQFGANFYYADYKGTYKGRGDKQEKYPYEGKFERDKNEFNRYVSPNSSNYDKLFSASERKIEAYSAATNKRGTGSLSYGLASTKPVVEPIVGIEVAAGVTPKTANLPDVKVTAPNPSEPKSPKSIDFKPVDPTIHPPTIESIDIPVVEAPSTGNGDSSWVWTKDLATSKQYATNSYYMDDYDAVAPIAQQDMTNGTLTVTINDPVYQNFDIAAKGITFTGRWGADHNSANSGSQVIDFDTGTDGAYGYIKTRTRTSPNDVHYAAMKIVGGHEIKINDVNINFLGKGTNKYNRWLFHIDGHNDHGESTFNIGEGTKINIDGEKLVLYTSQYHGNSYNYNIGFLNNGKISMSGQDNIGWLALNEGGSTDRIQYFKNSKLGEINLKDKNNILALIQSPQGVKGGFSFTNDGIIKLEGEAQKGIIVDSVHRHEGSEILLNKALTITGEKSVGLALKGYAKLEGDEPDFSLSRANNRVEILPEKTRESILNFDLAGKNNTGIYFDYSGVKAFKIGNTTLNSNDGENNTLTFVKNGEVTINAKNKINTDNSLNIKGGKANIGIYTESTSILNNGAKINITNSDSSTAIYAKNSGTVTNTGAITVSGKSVKAIIADGSQVTNTGAITVDGTALSDTDGTTALVSMNSGVLTTSQGTASNIKVSDSASIGAYTDGGTIKLYDTTITAENGAFNTYSKGAGGKIEFVNNNKIITGQKSLAFNTDNNGVISFGSGTVANIAGGTDADTRGTAFLYRGNNYSPFDQTAVSTWATNRYSNSLNNLTLNMASGSRLFIAQDVLINLSNSNASNLFAAGTGPTINGTDYKSFMLYLSKLKLDQNINLDNSTDAYNMLEVANSSIENNANNIIKGTQANQVALAQENDSTLYARNKVQLINSGSIDLSGANSTALYGKFAELENTATGSIKLGANSTALYGVEDSSVKNAGSIELGDNSTGLFSKGANTETLENSGTIKGSEAKAIGIIYDGNHTIPTLVPPATTSVLEVGVNNTATGKIDLTGKETLGVYAKGSNYRVVNAGEIKLGDAQSLNNPNIGIYTDSNSVEIENNKNITVGKNSIGIYGYKVTNANGANIKTGDSGVGIYSKASEVKLNSGSTVDVGAEKAVGVFMADGGTLTSEGNIKVGKNSYGIIGKKDTTSFTFNGSASSNATLDEGATFLYSDDTTATVNNATNLTSASAGGNYGLYSAGTITNTGNIDFSNGVGNVGIYSIGGGNATNSGNIKVGLSNTDNKLYSIGMATDNGKIENLAGGVIDVTKTSGIGMYATGAGSKAINRGTINLSADKTIGMYVDEKAEGHNYGTITTTGNTASGIIGVVARKGAKLTNHPGAVINISSPEGYGLFKTAGAIIDNQGSITISSGAKEIFDPAATPTSKEPTGGVELVAPAGAANVTIKVNGKVIPDSQVTVINTPSGKLRMPAETSVGLYVNTLAGSNPINGLNLITKEADLIFGTEATTSTNSKYIKVGGNILAPYNDALLNNPGINWKLYSGSYTWLSTVTKNADGTIKELTMAKVPYTAYASNMATPVETTDTFNFLNGLEQRYGVEHLKSREREVFNKLNSIGNNEEILFDQAVDEMMGHQYANTQQRIYQTGSILDKEFSYLRNEWQNVSKDSNKIKTFGTKGEYRTSTAGVIDYTNNAYGVAYVHENETLNLGKTSGWYTGIVENRIKFKDIGGSKEEQLQGKIGVFKSIPFDYDNSLNWTVSGELSLGYNKMNRRFWVVDDVFNAKSRYWNYGAAIKNEVSKDFRLSEDFSFKPYASAKVEYGRISKIREKSGEIKLEVKSNDYYSIKPEIGSELIFKHVANNKTFKATLGIAYENELGKIANGKNKARVLDTTADWFNIRGEKEDRHGNVKTDLKLGLDNSRLGITANIGYDTKGGNIRGGVGLRVIF